MTKKILLVEDDAQIAEVERDYLETNDFDVEVSADGRQGLERALKNTYALPILVVSAKREDIDKIRALGLGADDYVIKPFSPSELVARVKAHISRYERLTGAGNSLRFGDLEIQRETRRVFRYRNGHSSRKSHS